MAAEWMTYLGLSQRIKVKSDIKTFPCLHPTKHQTDQLNTEQKLGKWLPLSCDVIVAHGPMAAEGMTGEFLD